MASKIYPRSTHFSTSPLLPPWSKSPSTLAFQLVSLPPVIPIICSLHRSEMTCWQCWSVHLECSNASHCTRGKSKFHIPISKVLQKLQGYLAWSTWTPIGNQTSFPSPSAFIHAAASLAFLQHPPTHHCLLYLPVILVAIPSTWSPPPPHSPCYLDFLPLILQI